MITQQLFLSTKKCKLQLKYYFPWWFHGSTPKKLDVYFNQKQIYTLTTTQIFTTKQSYTTVDLILDSRIGMNNISITMDPIYPADYDGFLIKDVSIQEIHDQEFSGLMDFMLFNKFFEITSTIPGNRIVFSSYVMLFTNFDRLKLYMFHNRNYSDSSMIFLKKNCDLLQLKNQFLQSLMIKISPKFT